MNRTKIEWVKNPDGTQGYSWNPITGCLNHVNGMCKGGNFPCYAYKLAHGRLKSRYQANMNLPPIFKENLPTAGNKPFYPRFWPDRLDDLEIPPKKRDWQKPRGIFVCDVGELFGDWIPDEWRTLIFYMMALNPQHRFYLLTKQPQNLIKFSPFPENCWCGVTVTNTETFMRACSYLEYPMQAKVKFLSIEPLLEWNFNWNQSYLVNTLKRANIGWLIIGSQTQPIRHPKREWVDEIIEASDKANISIFVKEPLASHYNIQRQEYPNGL